MCLLDGLGWTSTSKVINVDTVFDLLKVNGKIDGGNKTASTDEYKTNDYWKPRKQLSAKFSLTRQSEVAMNAVGASARS
jgi:hypothetical protein